MVESSQLQELNIHGVREILVYRSWIRFVWLAIVFAALAMMFRDCFKLTVDLSSEPIVTYAKNYEREESFPSVMICPMLFKYRQCRKPNDFSNSTHTFKRHGDGVIFPDYLVQGEGSSENQFWEKWDTFKQKLVSEYMDNERLITDHGHLLKLMDSFEPLNYIRGITIQAILTEESWDKLYDFFWEEYLGPNKSLAEKQLENSANFDTLIDEVDGYSLINKRKEYTAYGVCYAFDFLQARLSTLHSKITDVKFALRRSPDDVSRFSSMDTMGEKPGGWRRHFPSWSNLTSHNRLSWMHRWAYEEGNWRERNICMQSTKSYLHVSCNSSVMEKKEVQLGQSLVGIVVDEPLSILLLKEVPIRHSRQTVRELFPLLAEEIEIIHQARFKLREYYISGAYEGLPIVTAPQSKYFSIVLHKEDGREYVVLDRGQAPAYYDDLQVLKNFSTDELYLTIHEYIKLEKLIREIKMRNFPEILNNWSNWQKFRFFTSRKSYSTYNYQYRLVCKKQPEEAKQSNAEAEEAFVMPSMPSATNLAHQLNGLGGRDEQAVVQPTVPMPNATEDETEPKVEPAAPIATEDEAEQKLEPAARMPNATEDEAEPKVEPASPMPNATEDEVEPKVEPAAPNATEDEVEQKVKPAAPMPNATEDEAEPKVEPASPMPNATEDEAEQKVEPAAPMPNATEDEAEPKVEPAAPMPNATEDEAEPKVEPAAPMPNATEDEVEPKVEPAEPISTEDEAEQKTNLQPPSPIVTEDGGPSHNELGEGQNDPSEVQLSKETGAFILQDEPNLLLISPPGPSAFIDESAQPTMVLFKTYTFRESKKKANLKKKEELKEIRKREEEDHALEQLLQDAMKE